MEIPYESYQWTLPTGPELYKITFTPTDFDSIDIGWTRAYRFRLYKEQSDEFQVIRFFYNGEWYQLESRVLREEEIL